MPKDPETTPVITSHRSKKVVAAASVLAGLSAFGAHPNRASAQETPEPTPAGHIADISAAHVHGNTDNSRTLEQILTTEQASPQVQEFIIRNSVYLKGLNCSGSILRDSKGYAVGIQTAFHCGLRNETDETEFTPAGVYQTPRITSANGSTYIFKFGGVQIETGSNMASLKSIGDVSQFVLPPSDSNNIDQALGVLPGHTVQEVINSYENERLPQKEINKLVPGESIIRMAGWPVAQNGDGKGNMIRQQFAMTYIGQGIYSNLSGERLNLVLATVQRDKDGAICSGGASGSNGFIQQRNYGKGHTTSRIRSVGVLSGVWAFTGAGDPEQMRQNLEYFKYKYPGVNWDGVDAVCGFSNMSFGKDYTVANVASRLDSIPSPQVTSRLVAETLFYSPEYTPAIVNGFVSENSQATGGEADQQLVIEKPVLFVNKNGSVAVGYYDDGRLKVKIYRDANKLQFYQNDASTELGIINTKSVLNESPDAGASNLGSFEDSNGLKFGIFDTQPTTFSGEPYKLSVVDGNIEFISPTGQVIVPGGKGGDPGGLKP